MCEKSVPKQALLELSEQTTPQRHLVQNMLQSSLVKHNDDDSVAVCSSTPVEKTEFFDAGVSPPLSPTGPACSYRLRFDAANLTAGDADTDFKYVKYPAVDTNTNATAIACRQLTPEQAEAALQYLVSCGQRISQMTRAYDDVNCLTDLLQEKERDLELAAIIGKSLLEGNRALRSRNEELETRIKQAEDACAQLKHDLRGAKQLLALYNSHEDADDDEDSAKFDAEHNGPADGHRGSTAYKQAALVKQLEAELCDLRAENELLRSGAERLERSTDGFETEEISVVQQYVRDLAVANERLRQLDTEVDQRSDDVVKAEEDKQRLANTITELEQKLKTCDVHLVELNQTLDLSYETEKYLVDEYGALQTKYEQVCECLQSMQEENRTARHRWRSGSLGAGSTTSSRQVLNDIDDAEENDTETESTGPNGSKTSPRRRKSHTLHAPGSDVDDNSEGADDDARSSRRRAARGKARSSLAAQLETSSKENAVSRADTLRKMLETVRCARLSSNARHAWSHGAQSSAVPVNIADRVFAVGRRQTTTDSGTCSDLDSPSTFNLLLWNQQQQQRMLTPPSSLYSEKSAAAAYCESRSSFIHPRRLAFLTESSAEEPDDSRPRSVETVPVAARSSSCSSSRTRNNINPMQTEHQHHHHYAGGGGGKLSYTGQLEIVKPLESSLTLHQWSKLCVPRMADVLEEREGVHTKGENNNNNAGGRSRRVTPSTSGPDMTVLLSTAENKTRKNYARAISTPTNNTWSDSNKQHSDDGHALIEHLLANISSHNRMHRENRLYMQQQSTSETGANRKSSASESALGTSLENSLSTNCTLPSSGIESPSVTVKMAANDAECSSETMSKNMKMNTGGVLTRAHLISSQTAVAKSLHAAPAAEASQKSALNSPAAVSGSSTAADKSLLPKSPLYREIVGIGIKQQCLSPASGTSASASPLLRKGGPAVKSANNAVTSEISNNKALVMSGPPESPSETDSID